MVLPSASYGDASLTGQTGLVGMPDARVAEEGTLRFGLSHADPYFTVWSSLAFFSRLELSGRYITIDGVPGFSDAPELGDYRDKAFDAKAVLLAESPWLPAVAVGAQDYLGTRLFAARYVALSKHLGEFDVTAGYGQKRIDGVFGGVRYRPARFPAWSLAAEYDANAYGTDYRADLSGAARHAGGLTYALGYAGSWWGTQLSYRDGGLAGNLYVAIPLMQPEFIPKLDEPAPYTAATPRAPAAQWGADARRALAVALHRQGFSGIHIRLHGPILEVALTHGRISLVSRAVGRAARTALRLGPRDMTAMRVTYVLNEQPLVTYAFNDLAVLERYFAGHATRGALESVSDVTYASSETARQLRGAAVFALDTDDIELADTGPLPDGGTFREVRAASPLTGFGLLPFNVRIFFNDPGAPVRYDTFSMFTYGRRLGYGLHVNGSARLTLFENVSDIRQPSTSLLPHVRSDIGAYRREGDRLRLNTLLINKYALLGERLYGRLSAGYYEEMYAGAGGQLLYLPRQGDWAVDFALDALRQRAPGEAFGFIDYSVVTALGSAHYRFPRRGVTATLRAGRFLAKDNGVRAELKRRFRSGVEVGAWYTWTNARDITNPGTPDSPYYDKGLFVAIPLNVLLTKDTQDRASMALADYTRDVGQMVVSPGDLYSIVERSLTLNSAAHDAWTEFQK